MVAMADGDLSRLPPNERALMRYVEVLTKTPSKVTDAMVEDLRKIGWKDPEIFEATFTAALFAFFNRMAEGFGLGFEAPWRPPAGAKWEIGPATSPLPPATSPLPTGPPKKPAGKKSAPAGKGRPRA